MNIWLWAAAGMMVALVPCTITCFRGRAEDRLAALEFAGCVAAWAILLLAQGYQQPSFYDLALTLALLSFGGSMVFARFLEKWL